jgi:hypothetical protein
MKSKWYCKPGFKYNFLKTKIRKRSNMRIRQAVNNAMNMVQYESQTTGELTKAYLVQAATEGIKLSGTLRLFKLPSFLAKLFGKDYLEVDYDTIIKINDAEEPKPQPAE